MPERRNVLRFPFSLSSVYCVVGKCGRGAFCSRWFNSTNSCPTGGDIYNNIKISKNNIIVRLSEQHVSFFSSKCRRPRKSQNLVTPITRHFIQKLILPKFQFHHLCDQKRGWVAFHFGCTLPGTEGNMLPEG